MINSGIRALCIDAGHATSGCATPDAPQLRGQLSRVVCQRRLKNDPMSTLGFYAARVKIQAPLTRCSETPRGNPPRTEIKSLIAQRR